MTGRVADLAARWVAFCERKARLVLALVLVSSVLAGLGAWRHAGVDSDLGNLIRPSEDLAWYRHDQAFKAAFEAFQQTLLVVVSGSDAQGVFEAARMLERTMRMQPTLEFVFAPSVEPFLRDHRPYYLNPEALESWARGVELDYAALVRLTDSAGLANAAFTFADQISAGSGLPLPTPLASLAGSFASGEPGLRVEAYPHLHPDRDRHYALLHVKGRQRHDQPLPGAELVSVVSQIVDQAPLPHGVEVRLTGEVALAHEEIEAALTGIGIAGTVSLVALALILGLGVRSLRIIFAVFLMLLLGTALTLGFATLTIGTFNTLALMFVVMFFGLGVDFAVHFVLRVSEASVVAEDDSRSSVAAIRDIGPALLLCMLTSSLAFLSFSVTDYRGLGELGIISAGGMVIAVALTLSFLPALFVVMGKPMPRPPGRFGLSIPMALRPGTTIAVTAVLTLIAAYLARDTRFDYSVLALRDTDTEAMSTLLELQREEITTDYSIAVLAESGAAAAALESRLLALPEVAAVTRPADWIPDRQVEKRAILDELERLFLNLGPVQPAQYADALPEAIEYLESVAESVPTSSMADYRALLSGLSRVVGQPGTVMRLNEQIHAQLEAEISDLRRLLAAEPFGFEDLPESVRARLMAPDGRLLMTVEPRGSLESRASMESFIHAVAGVAPNFAGRAVVEWGVGEVVIESFRQALALSVGCIVVLLIVYFRSIVLTVLVIVPLGLATLFTFALAQWLGVSINMANILVVPLIFGLGVDTGIHVVHRFTLTRSITALYTSSTSRAVLISGLTTVGTFFSLSFSPHKGAASVGVLLSLAIALLLAVTFLVLPALLKLTTPRSSVSAER